MAQSTQGTMQPVQQIVSTAPSSRHDDDPIHDQDRYLPIANVSRIMKRALPENAKIAKDAKECVQECVSEFIAFISSEAGDRCSQEKRKTINGEDVLWAMQSLGFENYCETLKIYLHKYRESIKMERSISNINSMPESSAGSADNLASVNPMQNMAYATMQAQVAMNPGQNAMPRF